MKEIPLLIKILSGKTCGMSMISMDIPDNVELNQAMKHIVYQNMIAVDVQKVKCLKNREDNIISFYCSIDEIPKAELVLNYKISNKDYDAISNFYAKCKSPKLAKDNTKAIMLIKNIIESYDPIIQVSSKK